MPWTCHDCNKVVREGFEYLQISYCIPCGQKRVGNDLRLAQLIHKIPPFTNILHGTDINRPNDWMIITTGGRIMGEGATLLDALLAAGITDD